MLIQRPQSQSRPGIVALDQFSSVDEFHFKSEGSHAKATARPLRMSPLNGFSEDFDLSNLFAA